MKMVRKSKSSISANRKLIKVKFLDGTEERIETEVDSTLQDVFIKACHNIAIVDTSLFGLAVILDNNQPKFLDLNCRILKYSPKNWKNLNQGLDGSGEPAMTVHLLVQYYVDKLNTIRDSKARSYYYRQLKKNYLDYPIMYPDDRCFLLAVYSMIAEQQDSESPFDPREFFPAWVVDKHSSKFIREHLPSLSRDFSNVTKNEAQHLVVTALCHETPIAYNMHLYPMSKEPNTKQHSSSSKHCSSKYCTRQATGQCPQCSALYFGIGPKGVEIFEVGVGGFIHSLTQSRWNHIEHIHYSKRKLEVVGEGIITAMYSSDEELSRNVLNMCQQCHSVHLSREKEKFNRSLNKSFRAHKYRESYVCSEESESEWREGEHSLTMSSSFTHRQMTGDLMKKDRHNRYSIISDAASSATSATSATSGIVSDRTCFSYYDSQEEFLSGCKTITSSQDSLLEPSESLKSRPVQRATSEPSQKFEQLRALNVRQQQPLPISRAASDDTVRSSHKVNDHIYENISEVRNCLLVAAQAKPDKLSPRVTLETPFSFLKSPPSQSAYRLQVQSQGALNHSMGHLNQLTSMHKQAAFRSQYNIPKRSVSTEQLLRDYQPPPSYNEKHKKVRERMLAAMSQETITPSEDFRNLNHRKSSSNETDKHSQKVVSKGKTLECTCRTMSYPELDHLKNMSDLPMISALFNDKDLQVPAADCQHCTNNNNNPYHSPINRPISWHSESFILPSSLPMLTLSSSQEGY